MSGGEEAPPPGTLAKLCGWILNEKGEPDRQFDHYITTTSIKMGRVSKEGVIGLLDHNSVSRLHLELYWDETRPGWVVKVLGKNDVIIDRTYDVRARTYSISCAASRAACLCLVFCKLRCALWGEMDFVVLLLVALHLRTAGRQYKQGDLVPVENMAAIRIHLACFHILFPRKYS